MASRRSSRSTLSLRRAYRIADRRHEIFDGEGAERFGGSWSSPRHRVIYAAETYAGAMLEVLVNSNIGRVPKHHGWIEIGFDVSVSVEEVDVRKVPHWNASDQRASRRFGDRWYDEKRSAVLIVPSAVVRAERSVVINQQHPEFRKIRASQAKPVVWDERLFR
jgi:RES domain-containing protein